MRKIKGIEKNMMERMKEYKWKGNVSELKNDVYSEVMIWEKREMKVEDFEKINIGEEGFEGEKEMWKKKEDKL